ncbi:hypothetical protein H632_c1115p1 [Helicosporidium sp. ATCC 50920]|nr:hypothetical protein H632_c1115p1 [Helicosporidium sp. ATCC 50920]|eukprot:KDD74718.1 hypothetical protein H632_c1115p1 [Helicosporidium sp. ATCC 50920]
MDFCKDFNAKTANMRDDVPVPVVITPTPDKKFTYVIKSSPASYFIKKAAGISKGSTKTGHEKVGSISLKHLYEIALIKQKDTPLASVEAVVKSLMGTCQSMGINVVARPGDEAKA